jgi:hypothetical protein
MSDNSGQISVPGLPREIHEWLREQAEAELTSRAQVVRRLIVAEWRRARDRGERAA